MEPWRLRDLSMPNDRPSFPTRGFIFPINPSATPVTVPAMRGPSFVGMTKCKTALATRDVIPMEPVATEGPLNAERSSFFSDERFYLSNQPFRHTRNRACDEGSLLRRDDKMQNCARYPRCHSDGALATQGPLNAERSSFFSDERFHLSNQPFRHTRNRACDEGSLLRRDDTMQNRARYPRCHPDGARGD